MRKDAIQNCQLLTSDIIPSWNTLQSCKEWVWLSHFFHASWQICFPNASHCRVIDRGMWLVWFELYSSDWCSQINVPKPVLIKRSPFWSLRSTGESLPGGIDEGVLGGSGRVVNSLDFCLASLKSLGCFYFRCILSSQWKAMTVNLQILHCQLWRHFWRPVVRMCLATSNNSLLVP